MNVSLMIKQNDPSKRALVFFKISKDFLCESISFLYPVVVMSNYFKFYTLFVLSSANKICEVFEVS